MIKCLIVDDEPIARLGMKRLVERQPDLELSAMLATAEEAAEYVTANSIDLIFLDIRMPGISGIEFAASVPECTMVIFTTAYSEYALDSYEVDAIDYLVKPIDPERFERAVEKARQYHRLLKASNDTDKGELSDIPCAIKSGSEYIIVKADRRYVRIRLSDIIMIEGLKDYVIIHTKDGKTITRMTIKGIEDQLPESQFLRVNKSYIVNIDCISSFDKNDIVIGTQEISIGVAYRDRVIGRLLQ